MFTYQRHKFTYQKFCLIHEGQHGSTFGGSALSCKVALASLRVMEDQKLAENAEVLGRMFRYIASRLADATKDIRTSQ